MYCKMHFWYQLFERSTTDLLVVADFSANNKNKCGRD